MASKTIWYHLHLSDLFKSIGNIGLNTEKLFLAFQNILYDEDFSKYDENLFKLQKSDNDIVKYILVYYWNSIYEFW